tara:strand:- start:2437 stop:2658 length:222 start_codon:yes stop_codon:yes gene_type:complete
MSALLFPLTLVEQIKQLAMANLTYKIVKKGLFESIEKFENRINDLASDGWIAVSISSESNNSIVVLMRKGGNF